MLVAVLMHGIAATGGVRDHTRLASQGAVVTAQQADELSLGLSEVAVRPIQTVVRLRGALDDKGTQLRASASGPEAFLLRAGQRARAFSVESRSQMIQARVTRVMPAAQGADVQIMLAARTTAAAPAALLVEIVVERGQYLSVPNDAVIEEESHRTVYVRDADGDYESRQIETGLQGELYTAVTSGLQAGEQVVTTGSFFIDADYKLKGGN